MRVSMLAGAIANHDMKIRRFGQPSLIRFFDRILKDGGFQKIVLKEGYDYWRRSFLVNLTLGTHQFHPLAWPSAKRPDFWLGWHKDVGNLDISWTTLSPCLVEHGKTPKEKCNVTAEGISYRQNWKLTVIASWSSCSALPMAATPQVLAAEGPSNA